MKNHIWIREMFVVVFTVVTAPILIGCGDSDDGPKLVPVSGIVSLDGKPLSGVGVSFQPDAAKGNKSAHIPSGTANDEGKYELVAAAKNGAEVGWYQVVIVPAAPAPMGGEMPQVGPPPFNVKYTAPTTTELSIEVRTTAAAGAYDLKLSK